MAEIVDTQIAIIGGGLTGQMMAHALAGTGYDILLIDKPQDKAASISDYRTTTIHAAGKRMLEALNIWQKLDIDAEPITSIKVGQDNEARAWPLRFQSETEPMAYTVHNQSLLQASSCSSASQLYGHITSIDFSTSRPTWHFDDGRRGIADILIGCDGARSFTREQAGLPVWNRQTNQKAIIAHVSAEKHHNQTAFQRFLPEGPLAFMPLSGHHMSLVWSLSEISADRLFSCDKPQFEFELNTAFGTELGRLSLTDDASGTRQIWPLRPTIVPQLTTTGLILAGDAAHALHPLAGMGFNLALADMAVLADCLTSAHKRGLPAGHAAILAQYTHKRRAEIFALSAVTEGLNRLFSYESKPKKSAPALHMARLAGWGMRLFGKSRLDQQISRLAMGGVLSRAALLDGHLPWDDN